MHLALIAATLLLAHSSIAQTAPTLIPFQGRLTNQQGVAYDNGQYTLTFNLYTQAVGGSTVWTERHEKVGVVNGMVNVFLGSIVTFPATQPGSNPAVPLFVGTKYLGITVDADANPATADPEMVPRTMLVPAFHAQNSTQLAGYDWSSILQGGTNNPQTGTIRADKLTPASITNAQILPQTINTASVADNAITSEKLADNAISAADLAAAVRESLVPPGTILPYGGTSAPTGYLMCVGQSFPKANYPALSSVLNNAFGGDATTFRVPDLRGQFLRGTDDPDGSGAAFSAAGRDPNTSTTDRTPMNTGGNAGNSVGSVQADELKSHSHLERFRLGNVQSGSTTSAHYLDDTVNAGVQTGLTGGAETRPKNAYVNYIIKY